MQICSHAELLLIKMTNRSLFILLAFIAFFISSCSQPDRMEQILELENQKASMQPEAAKKLADLYRDYAALNQDSTAEEFLLRSAQMDLEGERYDEVLIADSLLALNYDSSKYKKDIALLAAKSLLKSGNEGAAIKRYENIANEEILHNRDLHQMKLAYLAYVEKYPDNKESVDYSIKAANLLSTSGGARQAIELYLKVVADHPTSDYAPFALTKVSEVYETQLGDLKQAKKYLEQLIADYPESNFARDAQVILDKELLGLSDEEKFRRIVGMDS